MKNVNRQLLYASTRLAFFILNIIMSYYMFTGDDIAFFENRSRYTNIERPNVPKGYIAIYNKNAMHWCIFKREFSYPHIFASLYTGIPDKHIRYFRNYRILLLK